MTWTTDPGPRLLAALGLEEEGVRREAARAGAAEEVAAGLDYWVPTLASRPSTEILPAPAPGREDLLDPRGPVQATPTGRHRRTGRRRDRRPTPVEVPVAVRGARWEAARPALVGLAVVGLCVAVVLGMRLWSARAGAVPRDVAPGVGGPPAAAGPGAGVVSRSTASFGPAGTGGTGDVGSGGRDVGPGGGGTVVRVRVHVVGKVRRPGVVVLPGGGRVEDAVRAAGGFAAGADTSVVNLARPVVDGEQIRILAPGDPPPTSDPSPPSGSGAPPGSPGGKVNLNTADAGALDSLPGVGEVLAGRILAWREDNGRFTTVEELGEVSGIGEKLLAQLTPLVTL